MYSLGVPHSEYSGIPYKAISKALTQAHNETRTNKDIVVGLDEIGVNVFSIRFANPKSIVEASRTGHPRREVEGRPTLVLHLSLP
jgi:hypothetical protein